MNNSNCVSNGCGFGNNSILWIILILLFMPNIFGGCGNNGSDLFIIIIILLLFSGGNGLFGG